MFAVQEYKIILVQNIHIQYMYGTVVDISAELHITASRCFYVSREEQRSGTSSYMNAASYQALY